MQFFRPARGRGPSTVQEVHRLSRIRGAPEVSPCRAPAMRKRCSSRTEIPGTSLQRQRVRSQDMPRCEEWKAHRRRGIRCRQAMLLVEALSHVAGGQQPGQRVRVRNADDSAYGIKPESSRLAKRFGLMNCYRHNRDPLVAGFVQREKPTPIPTISSAAAYVRTALGDVLPKNSGPCRPPLGRNSGAKPGSTSSSTLAATRRMGSAMPSQFGLRYWFMCLPTPELSHIGRLFQLE